MSTQLPEDVEAVLREHGWEPGRRVVEQTTKAIDLVCDHVGRNGSRHQPFPAAAALLEEFGGLYVTSPDGPGRDLRRRPFAIDPTMAAATTETLADFGRVLGTRLFPIGVEGDGEAYLAVDEGGRVFALDHAGEWFLGASIREALVTLVHGVEPPRVRDDGTW